MIYLLILLSLANAKVYNLITYNDISCNIGVIEEYYYTFIPGCQIYLNTSHLSSCNSTGIYRYSCDSIDCTKCTYNIIKDDSCMINDDGVTSTLQLCKDEVPALVYGTVKVIDYDNTRCDSDTNIGVTYHHTNICSITPEGNYSYYICSNSYDIYNTICTDSNCKVACKSTKIQMGCKESSYYTCIPSVTKSTSSASKIVTGVFLSALIILL